MAITCSLLGHDFGEAEVEREREERGSEVVTSVREVAVCERCGAERILSENTEVTSVVSPSEPPTDGAAAPEADADRRADADDSAMSAGASDSPDSPESADAAESAEFEDYDAEDDDAVILTDDPDQRDYGDWPSESGQEYRPWDPDTLVRDEEDDDGPTIAEMLGEEAADEDDLAEDEDGDGSEDGDETGDGDVDPTANESANGQRLDTGAEVLDADSTPVEPAAGPSSTPGANYRCSVCGFSVDARGSSYRPGDSCPSCHSGYLAAAERNP